MRKHNQCDIRAVIHTTFKTNWDPMHALLLLSVILRKSFSVSLRGISELSGSTKQNVKHSKYSKKKKKKRKVTN
jgi:hypothetical protein